MSHPVNPDACYSECGFWLEGIEREGAFIAGRWESDAIMSILEDEYRGMARLWFPRGNPPARLEHP